jgi:hypothetical protein
MAKEDQPEYALRPQPQGQQKGAAEWIGVGPSGLGTATQMWQAWQGSCRPRTPEGQVSRPAVFRLR